MKVQIGKHYRPTRFERRSTNREFSASNLPLDRHELTVQRALLPRPCGDVKVRLDWVSVGMYLGAVALSVVAAAIMLGAR